MAPALTPKTTIGTLLKDYPFLLGFLADYHPGLKKLTSPVMRRTMGRTATLEKVAAMCGVPLERLMNDVAAEVARATGERPETAHSAGDVQVFADALEDHEPVAAPQGHPIDTFQRENQALLQITQSIRKVAERIGTPPGAAEWQRLKPALAASVDRLLTIDRHYLRKENQLFPFLERHGVEGPGRVMWALHDDMRSVLKELRGALADDNAAAAVHAATEAAIMADDMVVKEEKILFPMAVDTLSEAEWREIRSGETEIGYSLITDVPNWPGADAEGTLPAPPVAAGSSEFLQLRTGGMSLEQLNLMLGKLPLDVSFVDEHDEVRFYSEGERVFARSPGVIGRKVQNCHPPGSVQKVQAIIDAFRAGREETAEFWLTLDDKFLHIRYFAVRDAEGAYRGVLETVQNVTGIRALVGQRRLLDW